MKILLIVPKYRNLIVEDYDYNFPLGLGYISSVLKKANYDVDCINLNHYVGKVYDLITKKLDDNKYDIVCSGHSAIGYDIIKSIISSIKSHKSKPIFVLGGSIISTKPKLIFEDLGIDVGVIGESEETIVELLEHLNKKKDLSKVKGIIYKKDHKLIQTEPREPIKDLDSIPFPDFDGFEFKKQLDNIHCNFNTYFTLIDYPKIYPILTSRSCPFSCTFCYHTGKYRERSIKNIVEELTIAVNKYNINFFMFYSDCFAFDKQRTIELCNEIKRLSKESGIDIKWMCQIMVTVITTDILKILKDAGCVVVGYGFESFSPTVLKSMKKYITPKQIEFAFHETLKYKMAPFGNFIFCDVAETKETIKETLDWWKKNAHGQIYLDFVHPYPGSVIYEHCLNKGIINDELSFIKNEMGFVKNFINITDNMSDKEVKDLRYEITKLYSKHYKFVIPKILHEKGNIYTLEVKCPFCGKKSEYGNCLILEKHSFGFDVICRKCYMQFVIVSKLQKFARKNYYRIYPIVQFYLKMKDKYKKGMIS